MSTVAQAFEATVKNISTTGKITLFFLSILRSVPVKTIEAYQIILQMFFIGAKTISIIILSALFIGSVLAIQGHYILNMFGANDQLGQLVALSVLRELGPVMTALLFIGRAGALSHQKLASCN